MTRFYFDVHVSARITDQLRRRGVDVLTAQEDGAAELDDPALLIRARTGRSWSPARSGFATR